MVQSVNRTDSSVNFNSFEAEQSTKFWLRPAEYHRSSQDKWTSDDAEWWHHSEKTGVTVLKPSSLNLGKCTNTQQSPNMQIGKTSAKLTFSPSFLMSIAAAWFVSVSPASKKPLSNPQIYDTSFILSSSANSYSIFPTDLYFWTTIWGTEEKPFVPMHSVAVI